MDEVKPGELIGGRYRLVERLGKGGMGEVWLAVHEGASGFRRTVVCKFVPRDLRGDDRLALMLADEARILGLLHHPNIVAPVDFLDDDDGPLLVLEYVDGCSLRTALRLARRNREPLPEALASHIGQEVARALSAAHSALDEHGQPLGIVHRDVSPDNVLLTWRGRVRLADFGVARSLGNSDVTEPGCAPKGKRGYMSPEQAAGRPVGARSDIFSLGRVVAEAADLLCGPALQAVVSVATAERPEDRFPSAEAFAQALFKAAQPPSDPIGALGLWLARAAPEAARPPSPGMAPPGLASSEETPTAPPEPRKPFVLDVGAPDEIFDADGPPLPGARPGAGLLAALPHRRGRRLRLLACAAGVVIAAGLALVAASALGVARLGPFSLPVLAAARAELRVVSRPSGAEVYVDGRLRGTAPCSLRLPRGVHAVRVGAPGLSRWRATQVTLLGEGAQVLDVDLAE